MIWLLTVILPPQFVRVLLELRQSEAEAEEEGFLKGELDFQWTKTLLQAEEEKTMILV